MKGLGTYEIRSPKRSDPQNQKKTAYDQQKNLMDNYYGGGRALASVKRLVFFATCIVQELCESRGGRPGLSVLTSLLVSVDVKLY